MEHPLGVWINDLHVGPLNLTRNDGCEFRLVESYKRAYPRPILGPQFLDDPDQVHTSRSRTPPWFSNLLPEGPLRELIARQAGVSVYREFFLLHHLGEDLPGAVRIMADEALPETADTPLQATEEHACASDWHFSLAGVQLKFSARREGRGLTIPVSGTGGDWIVKSPRAPDTCLHDKMKTCGRFLASCRRSAVGPLFICKRRTTQCDE